jgi:hypothetical protein
MKLITKNKQKEIDELNIKKILFAMIFVFKEHNKPTEKDLLINYLPEEKRNEYRIRAEDIYYADNVMI